MLVKYTSNALGRTAAHLSLDDRGIDHRPAVLNHEVARNIHLARLRVHLNPAAMSCLGVSSLAAIIGIGANEFSGCAWRQMSGRQVYEHGDLREGYSLLRHAAYR